jgi:hypothetical protein
MFPSLLPRCLNPISGPNRHLTARRLFRPRLEPLEDRLAPATFVVTTTADSLESEDELSLRVAINRANATPEEDEIVLPAGRFRIQRLGVGEDANASGDFDITAPLTIRGVGTDKTIIDGKDRDRVFHILGAPSDDPLEYAFRDLTIENGATSGNGGGILVDTLNNPAQVGLTLFTTRVRNNTSSQAGGGIAGFGAVITLAGSEVRDNASLEAGGGIFCESAVVHILEDSDIRDNTTRGEGGGVFSAGDVLVSQSTVRGNQADLGGGGIFTIAGATSRGDVEILSSSVFDNKTGGNGGGIFYSVGILRVNLGSVDDNRADGDGGGIFTSGAGVASLANSSVTKNRAGGSGGGIFNLAGNVFLHDSTVADNKADVHGGGIRAGPGDVSLQRSTVHNNDAKGQGGGVWSSGRIRVDDSTIGDNDARFEGGGLFLNGPEVIFNGSTISGNVALEAGGIRVGRGIALARFGNTTISGNRARDSRGGGIFFDFDGTASLVHVTITDNRALSGGGVFVLAGAVQVKNTIIAANRPGRRLGTDVIGLVISLGHNFIGIGDGSTGFDGSLFDQVGTAAAPLDPLLAPLGDNGGHTMTHRLRVGSTAIDAGDNSAGLETDQRGFRRLVDADDVVDIGAFEFGALAEPPNPGQ